MILALYLGRRLSQTLPRLDNFYMVGQWAGVGGVPLVAAMARDVVASIGHRHGLSFVARTSRSAILQPSKQLTGGPAP